MRYVTEKIQRSGEPITTAQISADQPASSPVLTPSSPSTITGS